MVSCVLRVLFRLGFGLMVKVLGGVQIRLDFGFGMRYI